MSIIAEVLMDRYQTLEDNRGIIGQPERSGKAKHGDKETRPVGTAFTGMLRTKFD